MASQDPSLPPGLPEIQDEAAATPMWVPALGLGLFLLATVWMVLTADGSPFAAEEEAPVEAAEPAEEAGAVGEEAGAEADPA